MLSSQYIMYISVCIYFQPPYQHLTKCVFFILVNCPVNFFKVCTYTLQFRIVKFTF
jgi:hypothetical protein